MHQVITNLLSNAVKFTPAGGNVSMEVGQGGGHATLTISDTGVGIPPDDPGTRYPGQCQPRQTAGGSPRQVMRRAPAPASVWRMTSLPGPSGPAALDGAVLVGGTLGYGILLNRAIPEAWHLPANLAAGLASVALARRAGATAADCGVMFAGDAFSQLVPRRGDLRPCILRSRSARL